MHKIRTVAFDMGGVVFAQSYWKSVGRFKEIGLKEAETFIDPFHQHGIAGDMEEGKASAEDFRREVSRLVGREVSFDECVYAITGYIEELPQRNLEALEKIRSMGYRVVLLSNTNPFMMHWTDSPEFDGHGHPISHWFDHMYLSYEMKVMKPERRIFEMVAESEGVRPDEIVFVDDSRRNTEAAAEYGFHTLCPEGNSDWTEKIFEILSNLEA